MTATLSAALAPRPHVRSILDGTVRSPLVSLRLQPHEGLQQVYQGEGDADLTETGLSKLFRLRQRGAAVLGLPIWLKRGFVLRNAVCRADAPFRSLKDLRGKRVGIDSYHTVFVYWRGVLSQYCGVPAEGVEWIAASDDPTSELRDAGIKCIPLADGIRESDAHEVRDLVGEMGMGAPIPPSRGAQ